ncbi:class I SAM-dependent methyltransferase [Paenibacillus humicola]|uniref:class I SAM-dependent methyltransferase n=1 Tax=Paenibacillus humicola TaxID=3110540 RepID=UPI00237BE955|nr:class I SAM-dependent methyltransferase [Paenibacillus humicola]
MHKSTEDVYDLLYSFKNYEREAGEIKEYILARCPKARTILDVACGTGKHAQYLNANFQVDGIDISPRFVEIAQARNPASAFWCKDMTSFELDRQYDAVICLFSAIAYASSGESLTRTLKQMKKHTKPGGYLFIEPWFTPDTWSPGNVSILNGGNKELKVSRMSHSSRADKISILNFDYLIGTTDGITHISEKHELGLFTVGEMMSAFREAGLEAEHDPKGIGGRGMYFAKAMR